MSQAPEAPKPQAPQAPQDPQATRPSGSQAPRSAPRPPFIRATHIGTKSRVRNFWTAAQKRKEPYAF